MKTVFTQFKRGLKGFWQIFLLTMALAPFSLAGELLGDLDRRVGGLSPYFTTPIVLLLLVLAVIWLGWVFPLITLGIWRRDELFPKRSLSRRGRFPKRQTGGAS